MSPHKHPQVEEAVYTLHWFSDILMRFGHSACQETHFEFWFDMPRLDKIKIKEPTSYDSPWNLVRIKENEQARNLLADSHEFLHS